MDESLVAQKLESLRRCIQRVESRLPSDLETLLNDLDTQDIISLNLTRAVQLCVDLAHTGWLNTLNQPLQKPWGKPLRPLLMPGLSTKSWQSE